MNELEARVTKLESVLGRGNFNTSSVQQNDATFNGRFALVNRTALPTVCAIGELAVLSGKEYICSAVNTWSAIGTAVYGGRVTSNAAGIPFPSGWSVVRNSAGNYTITHNLGTTSYSALATPVGNDAMHAIVLSTASNSFTVVTANGVPSDVDSDFFFVVTT